MLCRVHFGWNWGGVRGKSPAETAGCAHRHHGASSMFRVCKILETGLARRVWGVGLRLE
ncbi:hypothetical protein ACFPRL_09450 [Pseudoclavibacter helvolus]